ncbi:hypothetical protein H7F51_15715 [Novosphingobium flavum]|uniref:Uncharacterized protein n=1 Tax=Novosphingobium flavum TaxID=1778672 RepID=A0A7X1FU22_9SPHN|nr:hypothetical protein [Novosphingobium flavum]MBC2666966.1 hypothetical protein [Novosphingobium flavum]
MLNILGGLLLFAVALICVAVGGRTLRDILNNETQSLSRYKPRLISRGEEPLNFWATMFTGLLWLLLGLFLLVITVGGAVGML